MNRNSVVDERPLGCHLSIARGLPAAIDEAENLGCTALQLFTHNPSQWRMKPIAEDRAAAFVGHRRASGVRYVAAHTMYLINLASPDDALHARSVDALVDEVRRAASLGLDAVVTHLGAHVGSGTDRGVGRIVDAIDRVSAEAGEAGATRLLLENTAGAGTTIGSSFEELGAILSRVRLPERIGVCFDTAHAFAAGYDLRTKDAVEATLAAFDAAVGIERLALIHLNDSKYAWGSRRDRHAHIGWGEIGREGLGAWVRHRRLRRVPVILETPKEIDGRNDADRMNLAAVRSLARGSESEEEER